MLGRLRRGRRTIQPRRHIKPAFAQPCTPIRRDERNDVALETGRTRLLISGTVLILGFAVVGVRLVNIALFQDALEPRAAHAPHASELRMGRADIVDRNGEILATTLQTASLHSKAQKKFSSASSYLRYLLWQALQDLAVCISTGLKSS